MWESASPRQLTVQAGILLCVLLSILSLSSCPPATSCKGMDAAGDGMEWNSTFTAGGDPVEEKPSGNDVFFCCHICNRPFRLFQQLLKHLWCAFTYRYSDHLQITGTPVAADTPKDLIPFIRNLHMMSEFANLDNVTAAQHLGVPITSAEICAGPGDRQLQEQIEAGVTWTSNDWRNDLGQPDPLLDGHNRHCVQSNCNSAKCKNPPTCGSSSAVSKRSKRTQESQSTSFFDAAEGHYDDDAPDVECRPVDPSSDELCQVCPLPFLSCTEGLPSIVK
jgi:hypothetical protein